MLIIQMIGILFGAFMAYYTYVHFKRKEFSVSTLIFWEVVWIGLIITVIFPSILEPIVQGLKFTRTLDLFVVIALIIAVSVSFLNYISVMKNKKKLEELVRKIALEDRKVKKR